MSVVRIAIDGPSASGKSTVAKIVAKKLNYLYVDTGAMYRAFTLAVLNANLDPKLESDAIKLIGKIDISFNSNNVITLNGIEVGKEIRDKYVADNVSYIASYKEVRLFLVELQREIASGRSVVMDGRDIGTYVLKDAEVKIFLIADEMERARRRYLEDLEAGRDVTLDSSLENIKKRDYIDSHREFCPLKEDVDSIRIDSTKLNIEEVTNKIIEVIRNKNL